MTKKMPTNHIRKQGSPEVLFTQILALFLLKSLRNSIITSVDILNAN